MTRDAHRQRVKDYIRAYNAFDIDGMTAQLHPDVVFQNLANGAVTHETHGLPAFRTQAAAAAGLFAKRVQTIVSMTEVAAQDTPEQMPGLRVGISYLAVLAQDLPNGLTAGATISLTGESEFGFRDGRICRIVDRS